MNDLRCAAVVLRCERRWPDYRNKPPNFHLLLNAQNFTDRYRSNVVQSSAREFLRPLKERVSVMAESKSSKSGPGATDLNPAQFAAYAVEIAQKLQRELADEDVKPIDADNDPLIFSFQFDEDDTAQQSKSQPHTAAESGRTREASSQEPAETADSSEIDGSFAESFGKLIGETRPSRDDQSAEEAAEAQHSQSATLVSGDDAAATQTQASTASTAAATTVQKRPAPAKGVTLRNILRTERLPEISAEEPRGDDDRILELTLKHETEISESRKKFDQQIEAHQHEMQRNLARKESEFDHWISRSILKVTKRAGVTAFRTTPMRWAHA